MGRLALVLSRKPLSKAGSRARAAHDACVRSQAEVRGDCEAVAMVASVAARSGVMEV